MSILMTSAARPATPAFPLEKTGDIVVSPQMIMPSFALKAGQRFEVVSPLVPPAVQLAT
jgi:hypothetical protein